MIAIGIRGARISTNWMKKAIILGCIYKLSKILKKTRRFLITSEQKRPISGADCLVWLVERTHHSLTEQITQKHYRTVYDMDLIYRQERNESIRRRTKLVDIVQKLPKVRDIGHTARTTVDATVENVATVSNSWLEIVERKKR